MVNLKDAKDVSDVLVKTIHPASIIMFGSVARDGVGEDLDLLVVVDDKTIGTGNVNLKAHRCLRKFYRKFSIDPFIIPLSLFREYYTKGSPFLRLIFKEGRPLYMKDAVKEWMRQSEYEFNMAVYLLKGGYFKGACYHSQQSIEKSVKTMLLKKGWELEKTHSIERLISIAEDYKIKINTPEEDILFIDAIYRGRYPAEAGLLPLGEPSEDDAEKAVKIAKLIFEDVR